MKEDDPNLFIFERKHEDESLLVICSFTEKEISVNLEELGLKKGEILIDTYELTELKENLMLKAFEGILIKMK